jgi:DNA-binding NtrC family response regulator
VYESGHTLYDSEHLEARMAEPARKILIVDDDEDILTAGKLLLKREFGYVQGCNDPVQIPALLAANQFDAILLDMNFSPGESSGQQGFLWLERILELDPDAVVVMITAHGSMDLAVEAMKHGATDFVAKPWQNEKVVATLSAAVQLRASREETASLKRRNRALASATGGNEQALLGNSPAIREVFSLIERSAPTDANILIMGENGTGKELAARMLHRRSQRAGNVFMSVDLGAVSETLFESELFGHRKGAFTGANDDRIGRLEAANGGTLFLDEIGNIPLHLQAKLLTVLEQREVTPVGANESIPFDVRVISATNVPREQLADESRFRQDLLFRLNTVELTLPPLRERREDIAEIATHYASLYARKYHKPELQFSPAALEAMQAYDWPGNVRALRHAVERAVILAENGAHELDDLQLTSTPPPAAETQKPAANAPGSDLNLERIEKRTIEAALKQHRYNISHAAKELGLTRAALYRRMEKHGL